MKTMQPLLTYTDLPIKAEGILIDDSLIDYNLKLRYCFLYISIIRAIISFLISADWFVSSKHINLVNKGATYKSLRIKLFAKTKMAY